MQEKSSHNKNQRTLAKGTIYITIGFVIANLCGYIIHFGLTRMISAAEYGTFGVILSLLTLFQLLVMKGVPNAVSKYISSGYDWKIVRKKALILQLVFSSVISVLIFLSASLISNLLNDQELAKYIRFLALFIPIASISTLYRHIFNGFREFHKTAFALLFAYIPRVIFVFLFVLIGFGLFGVIGGYLVGALIGLIVTIILSHVTNRNNLKYRNKIVGYKELFDFSYAIIFFSIFFQIICTIDILFIKVLVAEGSYVGYYTSARVLSTIFGMVASAFSVTLLPSISSSFSRGDTLQTGDYIKNSLRYVLMLFLPAAVIIATTSEGLLSLLFRPEYSKAATALSILIFGWLFLETFIILASIINASGQSKIPALITGISVPIAMIGNYFFVKQYGINGGALTTLIVGMLCFIGGIYFVYRIYHVSIDSVSTVKILSASLIIYFISSLVIVNGIPLIGWCALLFLMYFGILFLLKELNKEDFNLVKDLIYSFTGKSS